MEADVVESRVEEVEEARPSRLPALLSDWLISDTSQQNSRGAVRAQSHQSASQKRVARKTIDTSGTSRLKGASESRAVPEGNNGFAGDAFLRGASYVP
ncbi:hypothetical protein EYF80_065250 [Liparis tanakae]|uniref:Uncharacterized protein n=1 Tax=Liparis tanakae TaxID=230148 RepID=A0A4Z2E7U7_9TELE|nr:hypothetical protein EYF80_065250 [Liparis tanakae]